MIQRVAAGREAGAPELDALVDPGGVEGLEEPGMPGGAVAQVRRQKRRPPAVRPRRRHRILQSRQVLHPPAKPPHARLQHPRNIDQVQARPVGPLRQEHVRGVQVAMHEACPVHVVQAPQDLERE